MEGKRSSEARRRKVLDNAEARLRFIKEGIPWRNADVQSCDSSPLDGNLSSPGNVSKPEDSVLVGNFVQAETQPASVRDNKELDTDKAQNRLSNSCSKSATFSNESEKLATNSDNFIKQEVEVATSDVQKGEDVSAHSGSSTSSLTTGHQTRDTSSEKLENSSENFIKEEADVSCNKAGNSSSCDSVSDLSRSRRSVSPESNTFFKQSSQSVNDLKVQPSQSGIHSPIRGSVPDNVEELPNITGNVLNDPFNTLKTLLSHSSTERQQQKRRTDQLNANVWISSFIMLCLGVIARLSYSLGLSWLFREVMLVPFFTAAVPRLLPLAREPPVPSGAMVQLLMMAGVKVHILKQIFTFITVLRMFLQLFSIYLIAFVFTHQLLESMA